MSHANHSNGGESALAVALEPSQYLPVIEALPPGRSSVAQDPNSFAAVDKDCYGQLAPLIASGLPGVAMWAATGFAIHDASPEHLIDIERAMLAVLMQLALIPFVFFTYRISVQIGSMCSGVTFLAVAIFLPMKIDMQILFALGIVASFTASFWAGDSHLTAQQNRGNSK